MKKIKQLVAVMTPFPYKIAGDETVATAIATMRSHQIRHLPVENDHRLVGVVHERDLLWALDSKVGDQINQETAVMDLPIAPIQTADATTPIDQVLATMIEKHIDAVFATKQEKLVGVYTSIDVYRHLSEYLHQGFPDFDRDPDIA